MRPSCTAVAFAVALGVAARTAAQEGPPPPEASTTLDRALLTTKQHLADGRHQQALEEIDRIWDDVVASGSVHWAIVLCQWRADCFRALDRPRDERDALRDAIARLAQLPDDDEFVRTGATGFRIILARCLQQIEDYEGAETAARGALEWADRVDAPASERGIALNWIGVAQMYSGRPGTAWRHFRAALETLPEGHPSRFAMRSSMAVCAMLLGDRAQSLAIHDELVAAIDAAAVTDADTLATALHNRGFLLTDMGRFDRAERDLRRALKALEGEEGLTGYSSAEIHGLLSSVLRRRGRLEIAIEHARTSVELQQKRYGPEHPKLLLGLTSEARAVAELGVARGDEERLHDAERLFDRAVEIASRHDTVFRQDVFAMRGEFLRTVRRRPAAAAEDFRTAIRFIEELRSSSRGVDGPMAVGRYFVQLRRYDPYNQLARSLLELDRPREALGWIEVARARALLDLLRRSGAGPGSTAPPAERDAAGRRATTAGAGSAATGSEAARDVLAALRPGEAILYYLLTEADAHALLAVPDRGVSAYRLVDEDRGADAPHVAELVDQYRATFVLQPSEPDRGLPSRRRRGGPETRSAAVRGHRLFQTLIPDALWNELRTLRVVHVVPHGALHRLPFESLVTAVEAETNAARYWLDDGPLVAYAASGSVVAWSRARRAEQLRDRRSEGADAPRAAVVVADPRPGARHDASARGLPPLPGAAREGESIARSLHGEMEVVLLDGALAHEASLREAIGRARFLHVAAHQTPGIAGGERTGRVVLAHDGGPDDGYLDLDDLLLDWRGRLDGCELVVLSSCASAIGEPLSDEGMVALPWGIQAAGCPHVVATLWPIQDQATADLMSAFYGSLGGDTLDSRLDLLRQARRFVRATHESPFYWAPFVWIGAAD